MFKGPEKKFQLHIAEFVNREHGYPILTPEDITDTEYYFVEPQLWAFLKASQPETVNRLTTDYGTDAQDEVFRALRDELERRPLWTILRSGLDVRGHSFQLYYPKPRSSASAANKLYEENRITFLPELVIKRAERIDFGFFLNGLPIVTVELKHEKNQNVHDAVTQYAKRDHGDRIFHLPFLHIAADTSDVQVATDPRKETNFRWFNTGLTNKAEHADEYPVEFLYREVLGKESLLRAIAFDLLYVPKQEASAGKPERAPFTIFPRYHQRRCVKNVASDIQEHFAVHGDVGKKFLINHSAGSGKTLTICWLADQLHSLFRPGTSDKMVNMIFLLTDRKSLDKNIREDMQNFSHLEHVVRYAKKSGDLSRFLKNRDQIIVTTQQKFHYILDKIAEDKELKNLRVAFLIDEAHRSQEGRMATAIRTPFREMVTAGGSGSAAVSVHSVSPVTPEEAEAHKSEEPDTEDTQYTEDPQDQLARTIREKDLNQLFVAYTATPSPATVQLFGEPFDTYSEEEAIQEGYIIDVVQSIISYKTLYHLHCPILPDPKDETLYPPGIIAKALKNVAFQDSELIQYKAEVMLRIFDEQVKPLINNQAKAMIVATSRIAGLEYYKVIKRKLEERGADYKVLYAFSDFVHPDNNEVITEYSVNNLNDSELIEDRFEQEDYRLMIVASKFQTGFNQPLLAGMFLDKAVADRNAVQTVSRLNRCHEDKENVVVVDFTNNAKNILKAFTKYRHGSPHEPDEPDANECIELHKEILAAKVFTQADAAPVVQFIKEDNDAALQSLVAELRDRFLEKIIDQEERKSFVYLLAKLVKSYHFLSSFFSYSDELREFVAFAEYVGPQMIKSGSTSELMKLARATVVTKSTVIYEGELHAPSDSKKPKPKKGGGGKQAPPKKVSVQDMIEKIMEQFEITDDEALYIREVSQEKLDDTSIQETIIAHKDDKAFLDTSYIAQLNKEIQEAYTIRSLYEPLGDPKYTDKGAIFDIMAFTVIQKGLEMAAAA